jgi:hypothetical protein
MATKSEVWDYFDKNFLTNEATCHYCKKTYQTSGNTSNLWNHLKRVHDIEKGASLSTADTVSLLSTDDYQELEWESSSTSSHERKQKVLVLDSYFYKSSNKKKKEIDNLVIDMIAVDMQPLSIVCDVGFQQLIHKLDPNYKLPSKTQVKEVLLPRRYNEIKIKLKAILEQVKYVSLTTDLWTSSYSNLSYLTVTVHFLYQNKLLSTVLETKHCQGSHTAENITTCIQVSHKVSNK